MVELTLEWGSSNDDARLQARADHLGYMARECKGLVPSNRRQSVDQMIKHLASLLETTPHSLRTFSSPKSKTYNIIMQQ